MDKLVAEKAVETEVEKQTSKTDIDVQEGQSEKETKSVPIAETKIAPPTHYEQISFSMQVKSKEAKQEESDNKQKDCTVRELLLASKKEEKPAEYTNPYVQSFENLTLADVKKEREEKSLEKFKVEKEKWREQQFEEQAVEVKQQEVTAERQSVIEKPNYDLLEENPKLVKIRAKSKGQSKKKNSSKKAGIAIACALAISGVVCVANCAVLEDMFSSYAEITETYNVNLQKYLKNINNLDATKKGMEFIETYPEDLLDAGDMGQKSNWFDRLCKYIAGLFGG